jgi:hypothetical protein
MLSGDENKPIGKSGQRKRSVGQQGKKADPRRGKPAQTERPEQDQDQFQDTPAVVGAPVTPPENPPTPSVTDSFPVVPVTSVETAPVVEAAPVSYQTIANAYYNYAWQSLDHTRSFFEKLANVRSPNMAFELQTEFAKQSYESFANESQKIRELHNKLAGQRLKRWEDLATGMISPPRSPTRQA